MKHLLPYIKKYKFEAFFAPFFKMLEASFDLLVPIIVAGMIDVGISGHNVHYLVTRFLLLACMAILGLVCSFAAQYFAARAAVGTASSLRKKLLEKIHTFSYTELDKINTSTLITRMTSDINQVQNGINMFLRLFLRSPFIVIGAIISAFVVNPNAAAIFLGIIVILLVIVFGIMIITAPMYKNVQKNLDNVTCVTRESLNGVRVIRAFNREETQKNKFFKTDNLLLKAQTLVGRVAALTNPMTYVVINIGIISVLWMGAVKVSSGSMLSGDVIALINYMSQVLIEVVKLANLVIILGKSVSGMDRIRDILDVNNSMSYGDSMVTSDFDEIIRFDNVSLKYNGARAEALRNISFSVKRGETVGIIGGTGSGKTTLVNLISRFYDATGGSVYLKGKPISTLSRSELLSSVAVVLQKARLFSGTIRSNLLWGNPNADDEILWHALDTAQASDFVKEKENGLDEKVEQGGVNFSGGQKQRLTIARALVSDADVLILDDSASALDYATDAALRKAILEMPGKRTVIIVSQRTRAVMCADKIIVLDDGRLTGMGTHNELVEKCSVYREIYESQFKTEVRV